MQPATPTFILSVLFDALTAAHVDLAEWEAGLTRDLSLDGDLAIDSFQLMQVARHLEATWEGRFSLAEWVREEEESGTPTYTVGALVDFVVRKLA